MNGSRVHLADILVHLRPGLQLPFFLGDGARPVTLRKARPAKPGLLELFCIFARHHTESLGLLRGESGPVVVAIILPSARNWEDLHQSVVREKRDSHAGEECCVVDLEESIGSISHVAHAGNQSTDSWRPSSHPTWDDTPVEAVGEPVVRALGTVQVIQLDPLASDEVVVAQHLNKSSCSVDKLPRLDDPSGDEGDERATADVDVAREDTRQIDSTSDRVATDVLEKNGKSKGYGEKEYASPCGRRSVPAVHHHHHQIRRVPVDLAVNLLASRRADQSADRHDDTENPLNGEGTNNETPSVAGVTREVTLVGHACSLLTDGLVESSHHDPGDAPARSRRHILALVEDRPDAFGHRERPYHHGEHALRSDEQERHRDEPEDREANHLAGCCRHACGEGVLDPAERGPDCRESDGDELAAVPALQGVPNEVEHDSLDQRDVGASETPCITILDGEADVPGDSDPANDASEERDDKSRDYNDGHGLPNRETLRQERVWCLPCRYVESTPRCCTKVVEPAPCSSRRRHRNQVAVAPSRSFLMTGLVGLEDRGLLDSANNRHVDGLGYSATSFVQQDPKPGSVAKTSQRSSRVCLYHLLPIQNPPVESLARYHQCREIRAYIGTMPRGRRPDGIECLDAGITSWTKED
ncbi:hypothetical protein LIA77_11238 [Sarocladium implicatum]|nr:hypothetical protein LIA77_11238 [Sarocladium implicatum]